MQKISPFLWFDSDAEEAAKFYTSIFKNSKTQKITHYPEEAAKKIGREPGSVMTVEFTLDGLSSLGFKAGPNLSLTEAVRLGVRAERREEVIFKWGNWRPAGASPGC